MKLCYAHLVRLPGYLQNFDSRFVFCFSEGTYWLLSAQLSSPADKLAENALLIDEEAADSSLAHVAALERAEASLRTLHTARELDGGDIFSRPDAFTDEFIGVDWLRRR